MNISSCCDIESYECTNKSTILQGVKEVYTTSVQSFKPVLDSYQTSTSASDRPKSSRDKLTAYSHPDSYRISTSASFHESESSLGLEHGSKYPQHKQREIVYRPVNQELKKSNSVPLKHKNEDQFFPNQCVFQDREVVVHSDLLCDNFPMNRRQPLIYNTRHTERMPMLPSRRYSCPPLYDYHQHDVSNYCNIQQSNCPRRYHDSELQGHYISSHRLYRPSPLHFRRRPENIFRRHSLRGRASLSFLETSHDLSY